MPSYKILISGAGVTGPVLAHFLAHSKHQHEITIVERSPSPRLTGQNVDLRGSGLEAIRRMGASVEAAIRSKTTQEKGLRFVDSDTTVWAEFPVNEDKSFTSEIEIMRGDLASILYDATKNLSNVRYVFGEHVASLDQTASSITVTVTFTNDILPPSTFDIVIGADGWSSQTRSLAFSPTVTSTCEHDLGQHTAFFAIPYDPVDGTWSQWHNAPGGRLILLRPDSRTNTTRVWLSITHRPPSTDPVTRELAHALSQPPTTQKQILTTHFRNVDFPQTSRILAGMQTATDFYYQRIAQIKLPAWHTGRVVLVGDAAYAPSPITGMGTTLAITGAYTLAHCINRHPDPESAFRTYESQMKGFVEQCQKLMPGAPWIANPQTRLGIWILNWALWVVTVLGLNRIGGGGGAVAGRYVLPDDD